MVSKEKIIMLRSLVECFNSGKRINLQTDNGNFKCKIISYSEGSAAELEPDPETGQMWDSPIIPLIFMIKVDNEEEIKEIKIRNILGFESLD